MKTLEEIEQETLKSFDELVGTLDKAAYKEVLEMLIGSLEARLDCVKEEISEEEK